MKLIWKLLRQHISVLQLVGFFFANLLGMLIVLLSIQFYNDVKPAFSQEDGFMKNDYLVVSKSITTIGGLTGSNTEFSEEEIKDIEAQGFVKKLGAFTPSQYTVVGAFGIQGVASISTEMFFESVPDEFVDVDKSVWGFEEGDRSVPIVLPRSYLALYNFGFASTKSLPKISEDLASSIDITIVMRGAGLEERIRGKVVGFSNRLNTILAPEAFIQWSNARFAPSGSKSPTRLILQVYNPADAHIVEYFQDKGYEIADDKLDAGKTTFFLRLISFIVMAIGLLISALSFYILMLSIYLLVQKNTHKLQNLLLIGYSPSKVSLPYQLLTIGMNAMVLVLALVLLFFMRGYYMDMLLSVFPEMDGGSVLPALLIGLLLFAVVSIFNVMAVRNKVMAIWRNKQ